MDKFEVRPQPWLRYLSWWIASSLDGVGSTCCLFWDKRQTLFLAEPWRGRGSVFSWNGSSMCRQSVGPVFVVDSSSAFNICFHCSGKIFLMPLGRNDALMFRPLMAHLSPQQPSFFFFFFLSSSSPFPPPSFCFSASFLIRASVACALGIILF